MTYDQQIIDLVADRPLSHSEIADRLARGDNRAWGRIGTSLTRLYRAGLLSREKIGRYWHYRVGGSAVGVPTYAELTARLSAIIAASERLLALDGNCDYIDGEPDVCPGIEKVGGPCHWCGLRAAIREAKG
jgi:hypothetical protein